MKNARAIFTFLTCAMDRGESCALVTITEVTGGSSRAPGTHMAVSETGAFAGSFSGGCVEAAVVGEAQRLIAEGRAESIRFGAGSPYIDVRLPCGGSIDFLVTPAPDRAAIEAAAEMLAQRRPAALLVGTDGSLQAREAEGATGWTGGAFLARHDPDLRILILGHGEEVGALVRQARVYGAEVAVGSPDAAIVNAMTAAGVDAALLKTAGSPLAQTDAYSAIVLLFHDHDWELPVLARLLDRPAFYIGAMGSRTTHARRIEALAETGTAPELLARIRGPIGSIPTARDPDTLALSALAEIAAEYRAATAHGRSDGVSMSRSEPAGAATRTADLRNVRAP